VTDRLTLATSTGLPFLVLAFHFATGLLAIGAGFVAMAAPKGGTWHRRAGVTFACAMIATGIAITALGILEGKPDNTGGVLVMYLVLTGWTTIRPLPGTTRRTDMALAVLPLTFAAMGYSGAVIALGRPGNQLDGVPAGMLLFLATMQLLAFIGDVRMIRAGGLRGTRRLARHLWRMSFALFIASGSFFLGQMKFVPAPIRSVPLLVALGVSPLVMLLYWMWRVRAKGGPRGTMGAARGPLELHGGA
jgi:uncharacterized membrane protein